MFSVLVHMETKLLVYFWWGFCYGFW